MSALMTHPFAPEEVIGLAVLACVTAVVIIALINRHKRQSLRDDMEATLKMEMIQRGMSAGDIKQVLETRMSESKGPMVANLEDAGAGLVHRACRAARSTLRRWCRKGKRNESVDVLYLGDMT